MNFVSYNLYKLNIDGITVALPAVIDKIILYKNLIIAKLSLRELEDLDFNKYRNIFAVDQIGKIVWQIEPSRIKDTCYANVYITETGKLECNDFSGHTYDLDPQTGKISNPVFTR